MILIGRRVRAVRRATGLSPQYIADRLNIRRSTLSRYETGKLKLDADLLPLLGEIMRVDPCVFLSEAITEPTSTRSPAPKWTVTPSAILSAGAAVAREIEEGWADLPGAEQDFLRDIAEARRRYRDRVGHG